MCRVGPPYLLPLLLGRVWNPGALVLQVSHQLPVQVHLADVARCTLGGLLESAAAHLGELNIPDQLLQGDAVLGLRV